MHHRTMAIVVPRLGTEAEMQAQAIEQIRARVKYQKELLASQNHGHDDKEEMYRWVKITMFVAVPVMVVSSLYSLFFDEHAHPEEGPLPEYMRIRSKEFPWECSDCDFLDKKCWTKCLAEKEGQ